MRNPLLAFSLCGLLLSAIAGCGGASGHNFNPGPSDGGACDGANCNACKADIFCPISTPRCDMSTGKCVRCLIASDNCPIGTRCVQENNDYVCTAMCKVSADCPKGGAAKECCGSVCLDTSSDAKNCGGCGKPCPPPANATASCTAGVCGLGTCTTGFADCDKMAANGCEADLARDLMNCGACGTSCTKLPNANGLCGAGMCTIASCSAGFGDCDHSAKNGCEADVSADIKNCGQCGKVCATPANAAPACATGTCGLGACKTGFADCDMVAGNGCETATDSDPRNCGACNNLCNAQNGTAGCKSGNCTVAACDPGFADCDMSANNGCEVNIGNDVANCGACNKPCPQVANGFASCGNATCAIGGCNQGFANCDGNFKSGCNVDLTTPMNCGKCNNACPALPNATAGCNGGVCGLGMCNVNWGDCDGNVQNGCETNVTSDVNNCGGCGKACGQTVKNAIAKCANNQCGLVSCNFGFGNCNNIDADGCEANFATDARNCGACNKVCPNGQACNNGMCVACNNTVLVLGDDQVAADMQLVTAINNAGLNATLIQGGDTTYQGNPSAANYGAVVVLVGNNYATDMPVAGQQAILNAAGANGGTGVVFTEWAAYQWSSTRWQTMKALQILQRTGGNTSVLTFTLQTLNHPIWNGLPNSFTTVNQMGSNTGSTLMNGGVQIASCTQCASAGVAVRDNGTGRIVQIAHAGNYNNAPATGQLTWGNDTNTTRMMVNAVRWATRCP